MRIKRKDANVVKICEASQVKVKTAGDTTVIQFCAGQNKNVQCKIYPKIPICSKKLGRLKKRRKLKVATSHPKVLEEVSIVLWI